MHRLGRAKLERAASLGGGSLGGFVCGPGRMQRIPWKGFEVDVQPETSDGSGNLRARVVEGRRAGLEASAHAIVRAAVRREGSSECRRSSSRRSGGGWV